MRFGVLLLPYSVLALAACLLFSSSCSTTPQGKFNETDSTGITSIDTSLKYLVETKSACDPSWSKENIVLYHWKSAPSGLHPTNDLMLSSTRVIMEYTQGF